MARTKKFGKKRFAGNQHNKKNSSVPVPVNAAKPGTSKASTETPNARQPGISASSKKISIGAQEVKENISLNNIIIQIETLSQFLRSSVCCKYCRNSDCMIAEEELSSRRGLSVSLRFRCLLCGNSASTMSSPKTSNVYDINLRMVYGMRCIGKGKNGAETLCAVLNLPPPPTNFNSFHANLINSLQIISNKSMIEATDETVSLGGVGRDITAAFDGSWQKRGHSSLNGVSTTTSLETGKVIDFECLSKYCSTCSKPSSAGKPHHCQKNYTGYSGGMELKGVEQIFKRSIDTRGVRYINFLGDGDSKAYDHVAKENIYGDDCPIDKIECVGHVQKRMGSRLRNLKKTLGKTKLIDKKSISGKNRLTDSEILLLQKYYGLAITRNMHKTVKDMNKGVWAIYFHKLSTDELPQHGMCPTDENTWCGYHKAKKAGKIYKHKHSLPEAVMFAIKPVFRALSDVKLLAKCLHGRTQNPNESFHNCVWERLPKTTFHGFTTLKLGVMDAVICFNDGAQKRLEVMKHLGIEPGFYMTSAFQRIDKLRVYKAERAAKSSSKEARQLKSIQKTKSEHTQKMDTSQYGAGAF